MEEKEIKDMKESQISTPGTSDRANYRPRPFRGAYNRPFRGGYGYRRPGNSGWANSRKLKKRRKILCHKKEK